MFTFLFPNEIIIIIYTHADIETKYKLITLYRWLLKVKLNIKCGNGSCYNNSIYLLKFKIQFTHDITLQNEHSNVCNKKYLYIIKSICSLKCKKTLILKYYTINELSTNELSTHYIDKICKKKILILKYIDNADIKTNLTGDCDFYYGNGYGNEWYNTDYRIYYNNKHYNNSIINLEYYIYDVNKCLLCSNHMFYQLIIVKGFVLDSCIN